MVHALAWFTGVAPSQSSRALREDSGGGCVLGTKAGGALQLAAAPLGVGSHSGLALLTHTQKSHFLLFLSFYCCFSTMQIHLTATVA